MADLYGDLMATSQAQPDGLWSGLMQPRGGTMTTAQAGPVLNEVHTISEGPEYNKWDEALQQYGRIRIPKELDNPQTWLNAPHLKTLLDNIDRRDMPDGSVILSRIQPMS